MFEIKGKYADAIVFTDILDTKAVEQIETLLNQPFMRGTNPRFMPDSHAGKGCVIGTTMKVTDEICPNLVGVDIACGVLVVALGQRELDLEAIDQAVRQRIPAGFQTHRQPKPEAEVRARFGFWFDDLAAYRALGSDTIYRAKTSFGTLGGGNHFIEIAEDEAGQRYLLIHSGSRNLGHQIAEYYQNLAIAKLGTRPELLDRPRDLASLHRKHDAREFKNYLHDSEIARKFAQANRIYMAEAILGHITEAKVLLQPNGAVTVGDEASDFHWFESVHNYIDQRDPKQIILRKGAISAHAGEQVIIPLNMRDGSLMARGKGNPNWNYSGPHGAGRIMSRTQARRQLKLSDFRASMDGIYSTTVQQSTIDEAPFAYKAAQEIIDSIDDSLEITARLKPIYNFKAK